MTKTVTRRRAARQHPTLAMGPPREEESTPSILRDILAKGPPPTLHVEAKEPLASSPMRAHSVNHPCPGIGTGPSVRRRAFLVAGYENVRRTEGAIPRLL